MGSIHKAECECGYSKDVTVGSTKAAFKTRSLFPFYCKNCGLVEVNVAVVPDDVTEVTCPHCKAATIVQYGVPPVSLHDMRTKSAEVDQGYPAPKKQAALQWVRREASESWHFCPACHKMTLKFSLMPSLLFD